MIIIKKGTYSLRVDLKRQKIWKILLAMFRSQDSRSCILISLTVWIGDVKISLIGFKGITLLFIVIQDRGWNWFYFYKPVLLTFRKS
jgi:hypothetical protein